MRIAQAAIWLGVALCLWLVFFSPPNPSDRAIDGLVAPFGATFILCAAVAFEIYLRLYVVRIEKESDTLLVTTLATLHHRRVWLPVAATSLGDTHHEQAPAFLAPGYDTSWRGLRVKGRMLPFIVDVTATTRSFSSSAR